MRTKQFVMGLATPTVLILALLVFAVSHFRGTLAQAEQQNNLFRGYTAYNAGLLEMDFNRDNGKDRPSIRYDGSDVLNYEEWSSEVVVDGQVYGLWDEVHGYTYDDGERKVFSTISGPGWQVVEVTSVQDSNIQIAYSFDANIGDGLRTTAPRGVTLIVNHRHDYWLNPAVTQQTFEGGIIPEAQDGLPVDLGGATLHARWRVSLQSKPADGVQSDMLLGGPNTAHPIPANAAPNTAQTLINQFTTTYTLINPEMNVLTPLGTETITILPQASA